MRARTIVSLLIMGLAISPVSGQGILSDMMSGKLIEPEVGVFAWYTLRDNATQKEYFLRQAIVASEKVNRKDGYWLETELVPKIGFPSIYKMLLTGPARDPKNVHRLVVREGQGAIEDIDVSEAEAGPKTEELPRAAAGSETITFPGGEVETEHFIVEDSTGTTEIWVSDQVRPMGLVRMKTPQGELMLQRYGVGGKDGNSALPVAQAPQESEAPSSDKSVDAGDESSQDSKKPRTNFGSKRRGK